MAEVQYFKKIKDSIIFVGKSLEVRIPRRYENYDMLIIENKIKCLGIFEMIINGNINKGLLLPAIIEMDPSESYNTNIDEVDYLVLKFVNGDKFMTKTTILKQAHIAYSMFVEFISLGNLPKFLSYNDTAFLFDKASKVCGVNLNVNHSVFEMIYAHLFRDKDDLAIRYRHTDMKKPPEFIELRSVAYGTDSTTAKIVGSYLSDGINAALVNQSEQRHDLEDIVRL